MSCNIDTLIVNANIFTVADTQKRAKRGEELKELFVIENGAIAIHNGSIVDVGPTKHLIRIYGDARNITDVEGNAVLPGFIDPHTHAVFIGTRENEFRMRLEGKTYLEILKNGGGIISTVKRVRESSLEKLIEATAERIKTFYEWGTTTIEAKSGYGLNFESEIKQLKAIKELNRTLSCEIIPTFTGAHAIPTDIPKGKYIDSVINEMIPYVATNKLAEFIDVFCEKGVYSASETKAILNQGFKYGLKARIHSDEIEAIGCTELADEIPMVSCDHLLKITEKGMEILAKTGTIAVLLPGTAFSLRETYAPARKMIKAGIPISLATDCNPGSSFTESMPTIITLSVMEMGLAIEEAITACTLNAAYSLGRENTLGSIEKGKQADLIILKYPHPIFIPYHFGVNPIFATYKRGRRVYSAPSADR